jgi:hypothetical protein
MADQMEMEDEANQPSNTSGQVGERKRFEVKKVGELKLNLLTIFFFYIKVKLKF